MEDGERVTCMYQQEKVIKKHIKNDQRIKHYDFHGSKWEKTFYALTMVAIFP